MILIKRGLIWIPIVGIILAVLLVRDTEKHDQLPPPYQQPPERVFTEQVAGSGIVESFGRQADIGVPEGGIVTAVFVAVGDDVKKGQKLFQLDSRLLKAQLVVRHQQILVAEAKLRRLQDLLSRVEGLDNPRAVSQETRDQRNHDVAVAAADLDVAQAEEADIKTRLESLTVRAPQDGTVLKCDVTLGQYVTPGVAPPPMVIGDISRLQVRVDIDEENANRISGTCRAVAYPKIQRTHPFTLIFSKIEPLVVPKRSFTGRSEERVDTRVLQVIYEVQLSEKQSLYAGQQVDVFIETSCKRR